uniref:Uncharacterized protein n=1 Tax=Octopus bimaculoides TaxID=37653 RepID=A0A0L8FZY7_OCTBM
MNEQEMQKEANLENNNNANFASVAGVTSEIVQVGLDVLEKYMCLSKKEGTNVKLNPPGDVIHNTKRQTIVYKTWSLKKKKKIDKATKESVGKCLQPIWNKITNINRGKRYGTIEVRFRF